MPEIIYHYTSSGGLHGILSSGILYFTDSLFLNDRSERKNFYQMLERYLGEGESALCRALRGRYFGGQENIYRRLASVDPAEEKACRYFVLSCSREQDSLPMWNYYTRGIHAAGYNLHFKTDLLLTQLGGNPLLRKLTGGEPILCRAVLYEEEEKTVCLRRLLQAFSLKWKALASKEEREWLLEALDRCFEKMSLFYKDKAFSHEREVRVVIPTNNRRVRWIAEEEAGEKSGAKAEEETEKETAKTYRFREVRGAQVPFLALDVLEKGTVIAGVTAGPALDKEMAVKGVEYMLHHYGFPKTCKVSSVPLRY